MLASRLSLPFFRSSVLPFLILAGLAADSEARQVAPVPVILDTLEAIYPFSKANGFVSTPDGRFLYSAEGGGIALLDTFLLQAGMDDPVKRKPLGKHGPIAVRMRLDPAAADPPGANDMLFLAAGRDGLWVTGADVDVLASVNTVRIDDSGNMVGTNQFSRRWCCDVNIVTVGGLDYVAALFQKKNQSRLRFYLLSDVRTKFTAGLETGNELVAKLQVKFNNRPGFTAPQTYGGSMAMAMDVDTLVGTGGNEEVMVYVAMGHHGLARVKIVPSDFTGGSPPTVEWGPVFGDSTWYTLPGSVPEPDWYNNLEWWRGSQLDRTEPPVFSDVLVQDDAYGHFLYTAVDHLSWLRFDISGSWSDQMPIDHHEGTEVTNPPQGWNEIQVRMVPWEGPTNPGDKYRYTYARELALAQPPPGEPGEPGEDQGPILVVTAHRNAFLVGSRQVSEGWTYQSNLTWSGIEVRPWKGFAVTAFYRVKDNWNYQAHNQVAYIEAGGTNLWAPSEQPGTDPDVLEVFHSLHTDVALGESEGHISICKSFVDISGPMGAGLSPQTPAPVYIRDGSDIRGQRPYSITFLEEKPGLLLHGTNDAGTKKNGFLVTFDDPITGDLRVENRTSTTGLVDNSGSIGLIDEAVQWASATEPDVHYAMGNWKGAPDVPAGQMLWYAMKLHVPSTDFSNPLNIPVELMRAFVGDVADRFFNPGRHYYLGSNRSRLMDEYYDTLTGVKQIMALTKGPPTPEGVVLIDRVRYQAEIDILNTPDDTTGTIDPNLMILQENVPLITHPEYDWMDFGDPGNPTPTEWWTTGGKDTSRDPEGAAGAIFNFPPAFFQVKDPQDGTFSKWVLAVPCGKIWIDSNWSGFDPSWIEDAAGGGPGKTYWEPKSGRPMIQFWPIEPEGIDLKVQTQSTGMTLKGGNTRLARFLGSAPGLFWDVESVRLYKGTDERAYCFGLDLVGKLVITDITDILSTAPDSELPILWEWTPPPAMIDSLTNNVDALSIDPLDDDGDGDNDGAYLYVSVRRMGIEVLRFDPALLPANPLTFVQRIQTPGNAFKSTIRHMDGQKHLILADDDGAVRVYGD